MTACDSDGGDDIGDGNAAPTADAGADIADAQVGLPVSLEGEGTDPDEGPDALSFEWEFVSRPAGSDAAFADPNSATTTFTPDVAGPYVAQLTVSDGADSTSDEVTVTAEQAEVIELTGDFDTDTTLPPGFYVVPTNRVIDVLDGVVLTISPGVRIEFGANAGLTVDTGGAIVAEGTADQPIVLTGQVETVGFWRGLAIESNTPLNELTHVEVAYGGSDDYPGISQAANVALDNNAQLRLTNSTLRHSGSFGLYVDPDAQLPDFAANTFADNGAAALYVPAPLMGALDGASTYGAGSFVDVYDRTVTSDIAIAALDVPYRVEGTPDLEAAVTVEAGARFAFRNGAGLQVSDEGSMVAVGTASNPIVFTSASPAPAAGNWRGLAFHSNNPLNELTHVEVAYGGSDDFPGINQAANVALDNSAQLTLTESTIHDSAAWGVWLDPNADLTESGNTFSNNASGDIGGN